MPIFKESRIDKTLNTIKTFFETYKCENIGINLNLRYEVISMKPIKALTGNIKSVPHLHLHILLTEEDGVVVCTLSGFFSVQPR